MSTEYAEARRRFEALAASIGDRNSDLSPEEIEELATRPDREAREEFLAALAKPERDVRP